MTTTTLILFSSGLVLLILGAEMLVRGASRLAVAAGISPLVVGLTVVAFGTSSPELAVSLKASFTGEPDILMGNVVGSNVFNVLLVLGFSALIAPLAVQQQLVRLDVPLLIGASLLVYAMSLDGRLGRIDGAVLFAGIVGYTFFLIRASRRESAEVRAEYDEVFGAAPRHRWVIDVALVAAGLALLVLGARWLVDGAVALAVSFGASKTVVALTIVAAGTSLPEAATSIVASVRGERDIAVGNAVGSNLFNLLAVLGLSGLAAPLGIAVAPSIVAVDLPIMIAVAAACLPVFFTGYEIARWEGALFLAFYAAYTAYLVLTATKSPAAPELRAVMLGFVLPITAVTLAVLAARSWRSGRNRA